MDIQRQKNSNSNNKFVQQLRIFFVLPVLIFFCCAQSLFAQVVINEVMPIPNTGEPEWLELYNTSTSTISLFGWRISDKTSSTTLPNITLSGKSYAVLTRDSVALLETRIIPKSSKIIECKLPSLNNTTDFAVLRRADSSVCDSIYYNVKWGIRGYSLERVDPFVPAVSQLNFSSSESNDSATCGYVNSVLLLDTDARLFDASSKFVRGKISVFVRNNGRNTLGEIACQLWLNGTLRDETILRSISSQSVQRIDFSIPKDVPKGRFQALLRVRTANDERSTNDSLRVNLYHSYDIGAVSINEFLCEEISGEVGEFVEIVNTTDDVIALQNWAIAEGTTSPQRLVITDSSSVIVPRDYFAICPDSNIFVRFPDLKTSSKKFWKQTSSFNLNADTDRIILYDENNFLMDSVVYSTRWHSSEIPSTKGISLEKRRPELNSSSADSWTSSGDRRGSTPAAENSASLPPNPRGEFSVQPNPFSLTGKNLSPDACAISYTLPFSQARVSLTIFTITGEKIRDILVSAFSNAQSTVAWNGRTNDGKSVFPGVYIIFVEAIDIVTSEVFTHKFLVTVAP